LETRDYPTHIASAQDGSIKQNLAITMSRSILTIIVFVLGAAIVVMSFLLKKKRQSMSAEAKPWMRYAGMVSTGDPRSSHRIDEVIYGRRD